MSISSTLVTRVVAILLPLFFMDVATYIFLFLFLAFYGLRDQTDRELSGDGD